MNFDYECKAKDYFGLVGISYDVYAGAGSSGRRINTGRTDKSCSNRGKLGSSEPDFVYGR